MNTSAAEGLVQRLLSLPVFRSEWLLWLLLGLSFLSVAVMVERWFYYRGRKVNFEAVKSEFTKDLHKGDYDGAAKLLAKHNATESNVTLAGLRSYDKGLVVLLPACPPPQNGGCPTSDTHARLAR